MPAESQADAEVLREILDVLKEVLERLKSIQAHIEEEFR